MLEIHHSGREPSNIIQDWRYTFGEYDIQHCHRERILFLALCEAYGQGTRISKYLREKQVKTLTFGQMLT